MPETEHPINTILSGLADMLSPTHFIMDTGPSIPGVLRRGRAPKEGPSKIIKTIKRDGRVYELHATKGWRHRRA